MKIDELRVLKNDNVYSATSELQEKLQSITTDYKNCSLVIEDQNREVSIIKKCICTWSSKFLC